MPKQLSKTQLAAFKRYLQKHGLAITKSPEFQPGTKRCSKIRFNDKIFKIRKKRK